MSHVITFKKMHLQTSLLLVVSLHVTWYINLPTQHLFSPQVLGNKIVSRSPHFRF